MSNWTHKELWQQRGEGFCVEIEHRTELPLMKDRIYVDEGRNRWNVYAYIYPSHPHFKAFQGDSLGQDAATILPLHAGPSYLKQYCDTSGNTTSIQVGSDYHHDGDKRYTHYSDEVEASGVFNDAELLFAWLVACQLNT